MRDDKTGFAAGTCKNLRPSGTGGVMLAAATLGVACSGRTVVEDVPMVQTDAAAHAAPANGTTTTGNDLYEKCVGHDDLSRGSCAEGEICGYMPDVDHSYCMLRAPCEGTMVPILGIACGYPCGEA